jgi:hypothetical protein
VGGVLSRAVVRTSGGGSLAPPVHRVFGGPGAKGGGGSRGAGTARIACLSS